MLGNTEVPKKMKSADNLTTEPWFVTVGIQSEWCKE